jgi:hypothetical protein
VHAEQLCDDTVRAARALLCSSMPQPCPARLPPSKPSSTHTRHAIMISAAHSAPAHHINCRRAGLVQGRHLHRSLHSAGPAGSPGVTQRSIRPAAEPHGQADCHRARHRPRDVQQRHPEQLPAPYQLVLLPNGLLVLRDKWGQVMWAGGAACSGNTTCYSYALQNDGQLVIRDGGDTQV